MRLHYGLLLLLTGAAAMPAAENTLTPQEKQDGWKLLFDGKTFAHWRNPFEETPPGDSWAIEDGCLVTRDHPKMEEDLISDASFGDFHLRFDWKVSEGGNTGVKYRIQRAAAIDSKAKMPFEEKVQQQLEHSTWTRETGVEYTVAYEMQLIDDLRHPDAKKDQNHITGALYSMLAPIQHPAHPAGEWNSAELVLKGTHFEHWINGVQVLQGSLDDPAGLANLKVRWRNAPLVYEAIAHANQNAPFSLQYHGDKVWFRNIRIHAD